ncbi:MAG: hypothetical protein H6742_18325 [Alphaproteobacteria bacterium]|nr:hypothetical protein [Alphaproteobacteria bacterium]
MPEYMHEKDYQYHAAGRIWIVPELQLLKLPDGSLGLPQTEINRVHRAVANALCGSEDPLSGEDFEFLCDVAGVAYAVVADALHLDRSTLTKWRDSGRPMPFIRSLFLKRWFWFRLFGDQLASEEVHLGALENDGEFLQLAHDAAIRHAAADPVRKAVA